MAQEAMLSEFDYFVPPTVQNIITGEYDEMVAPVNALNTDAANPLSTIEFNITGASDLYRDLNNSYLMLKLKVTQGDGANLANDATVSLANLPLHSLFSNVSVTLCGKEITEKDTLYPYRAYLETLLTYEPDVLKTRMAATEGWGKDESTKMDTIVVLNGNAGWLARRALIDESRVCVLMGRPHVDLFHQNLNIPPNCAITIKFTPGPKDFVIHEAANGGAKVVLLDAKMFIRTKKACPDLVLAHKAMMEKANMRFPLNRVTVTKHGIATGFKSVSIPLNFPAKLPKRVFIGFVANSACTGTLNENPFNFKHFGLKELSLSVCGVSMPAMGLQMDFAHGEYTRAYLNTLAALGLDNDNRAINITSADFGSGFAIYGFKIAPGPIDGTTFTSANSVGSIVVNATFAAALTVNVDMIVYAETPAMLELDKVNSVSIV